MQLSLKRWWVKLRSEMRECRGESEPFLFYLSFRFKALTIIGQVPASSSIRALEQSKDVPSPP